MGNLRGWIGATFFFCPICFIQCKQWKCWNISFYFFLSLGFEPRAINEIEKNRSTYRLTFEIVNVSDFNEYRQQSKNLKQTILCLGKKRQAPGRRDNDDRKSGEAISVTLFSPPQQLLKNSLCTAPKNSWLNHIVFLVIWLPCSKYGLPKINKTHDWEKQCLGLSWLTRSLSASACC